MGYKGMGKVGKVNWYHRLEWTYCSNLKIDRGNLGTIYHKNMVILAIAKDLVDMSSKDAIYLLGNI
jgi:hypothetical protein